LILQDFQPSLLVLGIRGIPAAHGGFETFAEKLSLFLVQRGWRIGVYCQEEVLQVEQRISTDIWKGIERIKVEVASTGPRATLEFDWHCVRDAVTRPGVCLVLGYNSAVFLPYLRLKNRKILTNMDGLEWRRPKWSMGVRAWFWVNEWIAAWTSHHLIADHPMIAKHLASRRPSSATTMIPYGGENISSAPESAVRLLGLEPNRYLISIARIEPDNSILEIVQAFSRRHRGMKLAVLGDIDHSIPYHRAVSAAAGSEVLLTGGIYEQPVVAALRFHAKVYLHGHMVGGTNPSLVSALGAGNAVIAHDNVFNRWTAGSAGVYFDSIDTCDTLIGQLLGDEETLKKMQAEARLRAEKCFSWSEVLAAYERQLLSLTREKEVIARDGFGRTAGGNQATRGNP
jgi:glycosyltransferase involved in cell wall biosynthesis